MDHSEERDEELVNAEKRIPVSTTKTDSHRTALLHLVTLALHQQRVVDHFSLLPQRERCRSIQQFHLGGRWMGRALEVADGAEERSHFFEVLLRPDALRQLEEGVELEELLVGEGVVLVESVEFLVGELHRVQELVDSDRQLHLPLAYLPLDVFPGNAHCRRLDFLPVGSES